jgi:hypothetical protein
MNKWIKKITDILLDGEYYKPLSDKYAVFNAKELCRVRLKLRKIKKYYM